MTGIDDKDAIPYVLKWIKSFLDYTKSKGNDLYSVVKPGDKWCLCQNRWNESFLDNKAPEVIREATNMMSKKRYMKILIEERKSR